MKRTFLTIGTVAVVSLGSTIFADSTTVHAEPSLQDISNKQQDVKSKLSKAESKIADILYEIKAINEDIDRLDSALKENKNEIKKNEKEMNALQEDIDELNEKIEARNDILKNRIASYQESGGNINYLEVFLGAQDFSDFISRVSAVTTISNADAELIAENEKDKAEVKDKLKEQEKVADELKDQKETITAQKEQKSESKNALKEKETKLKNEKSKLESESSDLAALESEIRASIASPAGPQVASATTGSSAVSASTSSSGKSKASSSKTVAYTGGGGSAIAAGKQFIGKSSYSYGAQNPSAGLFDCSGFVQWAYAQEGVSLPRTASAMAGVGKSVPYSQAQPGDLVIFNGGGHVGIYLGGGKFLGSQNSTGVAIANMNSGYWKSAFDGVVRRVK